MSKLETPLTLWFWEQTGGLLIEEFVLVKGSNSQGTRRLDGLIVLGEPKGRAISTGFDVMSRDVIAVQTKARRLGMSVMGQCLFSRDLLQAMGARSVRSVALCLEDDLVLRPLLEKHQGCEVVIAAYPGHES